MKRRILDAGQAAGRVHVQLHRNRLRIAVTAVVLRQKRDGLLVAVAANGVKLLERQAYWIHQAMASRTSRVRHVLLETLAVSLRPRGSHGRQIAVSAWRWIGDLMTQEL